MLNENKDKFEFMHSKDLTRKEKKFYIRIFDGLGKLIYDETTKKGNNKEQRIKALEDNLFKFIKQYPELLYIKKYVCETVTIKGKATKAYGLGDTFLHLIKNNNLYGLIEKLGDNVEFFKLKTHGNNELFFDLIPKEPIKEDQQTIDEYNNKMKTIKAVLDKYPELLSLKDQVGNNFAGIMVRNFQPNSKYLEPFMPNIHKCLNDSEIATQQNNLGYNLGMLCAYYRHQELFDIAYKNSNARMQKNFKNETMEIIANANGLVVPPLSDEEVYEFYNNVVSNKIEDICK